MAKFDSFTELVKDQAEETQEKLDNLGHALDGEDISQVSFEIKPSLEATLMAVSIAGTIALGTVSLFFKDIFGALILGEKVSAGKCAAAGAFLLIAAGFAVFGILRPRLFHYEVRGSELIVKNKAYHCSDITRAHLGTMNQLRLYHGGEKLLSLSLAEYDNAEKLAAWLERCNIPVERDMQKKSRNETAFKIAMIFLGLLLGAGLIILTKKL